MKSLKNKSGHKIQ